MLAVSLDASSGLSTAEVRAGAGRELTASLPLEIGAVSLVDDLDADGLAELVVTNGAENRAVVL